MGLLAASGDTATLVAVMQSAFTQVQSDVTSMVSAALPIGLSIMGLILGIRIGINFFRSIAN